MPINTIDPKEQQAREIALILSERDDNDVTEDDVEGWRDWDIYEWIEAFGYEWDGNEWVLEDDE